ncbi:MAG: 7-cyano-7-deazaguanine synthase [Peptostreptococcaceae bacterium]
MNKAIILNSGGFDSVVMCHMLKGRDEDTVFVSLFFNYNQPQVEFERKCAREVANKLGMEHIEINLPPFSWSSSDMFSEGEAKGSEYIEMRNVIFLSYALSLAENRGAKTIYSAIIKGGVFMDTSLEFVTNTNNYYLGAFNIGFETPFIDTTKRELVYIARIYNINPTDFHSCNYAKEKVCGVCDDCIVIKEIVEGTLINTTPTLEYLGKGITTKFKDLLYNEPLEEVIIKFNKEGKGENVCRLLDLVGECDSIKTIVFEGECLEHYNLKELVEYGRGRCRDLKYQLNADFNTIKILDREGYIKLFDKVSISTRLDSTLLFALEDIKLKSKGRIEFEIVIEVTEYNSPYFYAYINSLINLGFVLFRVKPCSSFNAPLLNDIYVGVFEEGRSEEVTIIVDLKTCDVNKCLEEDSELGNDIRYVLYSSDTDIGDRVKLEPKFISFMNEKTLEVYIEGDKGCSSTLDNMHNIQKDTIVKTLLKLEGDGYELKKHLIVEKSR